MRGPVYDVEPGAEYLIPFARKRLAQTLARTTPDCPFLRVRVFDNGTDTADIEAGRFVSRVRIRSTLAPATLSRISPSSATSILGVVNSTVAVLDVSEGAARVSYEDYTDHPLRQPKTFSGWQTIVTRLRGARRTRSEFLWHAFSAMVPVSGVAFIGLDGYPSIPYERYDSAAATYVDDSALGVFLAAPFSAPASPDSFLVFDEARQDFRVFLRGVTPYSFISFWLFDIFSSPHRYDDDIPAVSATAIDLMSQVSTAIGDTWPGTYDVLLPSGGFLASGVDRGGLLRLDADGVVSTVVSQAKRVFGGATSFEFQQMNSLQVSGPGFVTYTHEARSAVSGAGASAVIVLDGELVPLSSSVFDYSGYEYAEGNGDMTPCATSAGANFGSHTGTLAVTTTTYLSSTPVFTVNSPRLHFANDGAGRGVIVSPGAAVSTSSGPGTYGNELLSGSSSTSNGTCTRLTIEYAWGYLEVSQSWGSYAATTSYAPVQPTAPSKMILILWPGAVGETTGVFAANVADPSAWSIAAGQLASQYPNREATPEALATYTALLDAQIARLEVLADTVAFPRDTVARFTAPGSVYLVF